MLTILLVEDDAGDRKLIERAFQKVSRLDFSLRAVGTLDEAKALLGAERIDLVLLDLSLPDSHGTSTIESVREMSSETAIIVLTGLRDEAAFEDSFAAGAQEYLVKGEVNPDFLPKIIRYAVNTRNQQLQLERANALLTNQVQTKSDKLRSEEEKFRHLVDSIVDYAVVMLDEHGNVSTWNAGAQKTYGYSFQEVFGKHFRLFFPDELKDKGLPDEALQKARDLGGAELEGLRVRSDGTSFRGHSFIRPIRETFSGSAGFVFVSRDTTELIEAHNRALQAERLAAIGQMVTGLAHESRNALQRIQASINRIVRRSRDNPEILEIVGEIERAGDDLSQLYEAVREYAAPINLKKEKFDILDVWREVWKHLEPIRSERDVQFEEDTCDVDLGTTIDDYRLGQVFRNLIENAIAACKDPVRILVRCRDSSLRGFPALEVSIRDNGPGFSAEARQKAFEAFFTTKQKGTGLGLAIIKRIVEEHGGLVYLAHPDNRESEYSGAEIVLVLPRDQQETR